MKGNNCGLDSGGDKKKGATKETEFHSKLRFGGDQRSRG